MQGLRVASGGQALNRIPSDVLDAMSILESRGYRAYLVGGCVRDLLLGREPNDYDIATNAKPEEVLRVFSEAGWKVVPKGVEFGVVSVVHPETRREIEIASFRREYSIEPGKRRAIVTVFAETPEEDSVKRDFTINALYMDSRGNILDFHGGLEDLARGIIRFVENPDERILEDPLRMLRAIRFAASLGFTLDPSAVEAIRRNAGLITRVSRERIGEEFLKAAKKGVFSRFVKLLWETGLYRYILPELERMASVKHDTRKPHYGEDVLRHTLDVLERLDAVGAPPHVKLAALLHDIAKPDTVEVHPDGRVTFYMHDALGAEKAREILAERLRLPLSIVNRVADIVKYHHVPLNLSKDVRSPDELAKKLVARYGGLAPDLLIHAYADSGDRLFLDAYRVAKSLVEKQKVKPLLTGHDIMRLYGVKPGPEVGRLKKLLYEIQLKIGAKSKQEVIDAACREYGLCPRGTSNG